MTEDRRRLVVAIDGPAGAGKSTAARMLAVRLGLVLIDTGALYRAVALAARERGVSWDDGVALGALTSSLDLKFGSADATGASPLMVDGADRSRDIRRPEISQGASRVSAHSEVRDALMSVQREMGAHDRVVMEGRDIGTVVFPDADVKIFLNATQAARAERRYVELTAKGERADRDDVRSEIAARDKRDSSRPIAPLKPAPDAVIVDSTDLDIDGVVDRIAELVEARIADRG